MLSREGKQTDRGAVGAEFIGYNRRRREALLLQEFPHQPNCRPSVPAGLNQKIQDFALTVHGTPEIELPPSNYDDQSSGPGEFHPQALSYGRNAHCCAPPAQIQARVRIEESLGPAPVAVDEVIRECHVSPAIVHMALLELELAGRLERHPGNRVALIAGNSAAAS